MDYRIPVSKPDVGADERALLLNAFDFGSVDTWGAHVKGFEADMAMYLGGEVHPIALSSGSAAPQLALPGGVGPEDEVLCPTLTHAPPPTRSPPWALGPSSSMRIPTPGTSTRSD